MLHRYYPSVLVVLPYVYDYETEESGQGPTEGYRDVDGWMTEREILSV
jgi:hypothetical protein